MATLGIVSNPTAGSGRGARWAAQALALLAARGHKIHDLSRGSWSASLDYVRQDRPELDALVVIGGDGMVHLGIQACAETSMPLGIIAAGSGNDNAASLGLPIHDIAASIDALEAGLGGEVAHIDLGKAEGPAVADLGSRRYFAGVLSLGIDAAVASYASRMLWPRGPVKYKVATAIELPRFKPYSVNIEVDGRTWQQRCTLVAVANSPMFGGGLKISPSSSVVDGSLELLLAEPMSRRDVVKIFPQLSDGRHIDDPRVRVIPAKQVRISPGGPGEHAGAPLPPGSADGELIGAAPLDVRVVPAALRVLGARADSLKV